MTPEEINNFSMAIEEIVYMKDIPYIDAVIEFCRDNNLEVEHVAKMVSGVLKSKIKIEAEDLHFLKKTTSSRLPL